MIAITLSKRKKICGEVYKEINMHIQQTEKLLSPSERYKIGNFGEIMTKTIYFSFIFLEQFHLMWYFYVSPVKENCCCFKYLLFLNWIENYTKKKKKKRDNSIWIFMMVVKCWCLCRKIVHKNFIGNCICVSGHYP